MHHLLDPNTPPLGPAQLLVIIGPHPVARHYLLNRLQANRGVDCCSLRETTPRQSVWSNNLRRCSTRESGGVECLDYFPNSNHAENYATHVNREPGAKISAPIRRQFGPVHQGG